MIINYSITIYMETINKKIFFFKGSSYGLSISKRFTPTEFTEKILILVFYEK